MEKTLQTMQEEALKIFDVNNISDDFIIDLIFNSLSFEHPNISKEDIRSILNLESNLDKDLEKLVINHQKAFMFAMDLTKKNIPLNEDLLKDIHQILMNGIIDGGLYRQVDISVNGSSHTPPNHIKLYDRMKKYFEVISTPTNDILEQIAFSHVQLAKLHPFLDGNGRLARIVLNYCLVINKLAPVIIPYANRKEYFDCLESFKVEKDIKPFINFLINLEKKQLSM